MKCAAKAKSTPIAADLNILFNKPIRARKEWLMQGGGVTLKAHQHGMALVC